MSIKNIELVDMVTAEDGQDVFSTLVESMTAECSYSAYENTLGTLASFPPKKYGKWVIGEKINHFIAQHVQAGNL